MIDHFQATRKRHLRNSRGLKVSAAQRDLVHRALAGNGRKFEPNTVEELMEAIDGIFADDFHRQQRYRHVTLGLVFRDQEHIDRYREAAGDPPQNGPRMERLR